MPTSLKSALFVSLTLLFIYFTLTITNTLPCDPHDHAVGVNGPLFSWETVYDDGCGSYSYVGCIYKLGPSYSRINGITFSPNIGLSGTIPSDFGDLSFLDFLTLAGNPNVTGPIPASLAKLSKLYHLDLGHNSLTGSIPSLPKELKSLDVSNNQLCGPIPSGLSKFKASCFGHN